MLTNDELHFILDEALDHQILISKTAGFIPVIVMDDMFKRFIKSFYGPEVWEKYFGD